MAIKFGEIITFNKANLKAIFNANSKPLNEVGLYFLYQHLESQGNVEYSIQITLESGEKIYSEKSMLVDPAVHLLSDCFTNISSNPKIRQVNVFFGNSVVYDGTEWYGFLVDLVINDEQVLHLNHDFNTYPTADLVYTFKKSISRFTKFNLTTSNDIGGIINCTMQCYNNGEQVSETELPIPPLRPFTPKTTLVNAGLFMDSVKLIFDRKITNGHLILEVENSIHVIKQVIK